MWKVGDRVQKATGYKWPGVVVSVFTTLEGKTRVVVECTVSEVAGALHIYSPDQLIAAEREKFKLRHYPLTRFLDFAAQAASFRPTDAG